MLEGVNIRFLSTSSSSTISLIVLLCRGWLATRATVAEQLDSMEANTADALFHSDDGWWDLVVLCDDPSWSDFERWLNCTGGGVRNYGFGQHNKVLLMQFEGGL